MAGFRHDAKHLTNQQQAIIRKSDERDRIAKESLEASKKEYKGYAISVVHNKNTYESEGKKGKYRESSHGDTEEDAINKLKEKIDQIDAYKEMYKQIDK